MFKRLLVISVVLVAFVAADARAEETDTYLVQTVQNIMNAYGGGAPVPAWQSGDYDSLYIVRVNYTSSGISARLELDKEGLNGLSTSCPR